MKTLNVTGKPFSQNDLYEVLKNIEAVLTRIEKRFSEHYPMYAESQEATNRWVAAMEKKRDESTKDRNCDSSDERLK